MSDLFSRGPNRPHLQTVCVASTLLPQPPRPILSEPADQLPAMEAMHQEDVQGADQAMGEEAGGPMPIEALQVRRAVRRAVRRRGARERVAPPHQAAAPQRAVPCLHDKPGPWNAAAAPRSMRQAHAQPWRVLRLQAEGCVQPSSG